MIKHPNTFDRGLGYGFFVPAIRHLVALMTNRDYWRYHLVCTRLRLIGPKDCCSVNWDGRAIQFAERASFLSNLGEIFVQKFYDFGDFQSCPYIIDCGANIGLASLYWRKRYGEFNGICFEPDPQLVTILESNFKTWDVTNEIVPAALSGQDGYGQFIADGSDSGHMVSAQRKDSLNVRLLRLKPYLDRKIDFLKIDIEGNEYVVLEDIQDRLHLIDRIFVEFHLSDNMSRQLGRAVSILEGAGFNLIFRPGLQPVDPWRKLGNRSTQNSHTLNVNGVRV